MNGLPTEQWHKIKCNPFYVGLRSRQKCFFWCGLLARCVSADTADTTREWIHMCSRKFRKFSRDKIAVSNGNITVSIEVVPDKPFTNGLFNIKASPGKWKREVNNLLNSVNGGLVLQSCYVTRGYNLRIWNKQSNFFCNFRHLNEMLTGPQKIPPKVADSVQTKAK